MYVYFLGGWRGHKVRELLKEEANLLVDEAYRSFSQSLHAKLFAIMKLTLRPELGASPSDPLPFFNGNNDTVRTMFILKIEAILLGRDLDYCENVIHSLTEEWHRWLIYWMITLR